MLSQASRDTIMDALLESRNNVRMRYNKLINPDAKLAAIDTALAELQQQGGWEPLADGEYDMDDGNVYKLDAGRKLLRYENGYYCGSMQLPRGWRLFQQQIKQEG